MMEGGTAEAEGELRASISGGRVNDWGSVHVFLQCKLWSRS